MPIEIKVPMLPESVADATLLEWHKQAGEFARRDENLVDVETDKVVLEVPAPADGALVEIRRQAGETVVADEVIALFEPGEAATAEQPKEEEETGEDTGGSPPAGPAVRALLAEHGLEAKEVEGTGRGGRILKEDVLAHLERVKEAAAERPAPEERVRREEKPAEEPPPPPAAERTEVREPMSRLRRTIAARLVQAQHNAAMLTTFNEVDMEPVMSLRKRYQEAFEKRHGVRLGFMSFFVRASVAALQRFPLVNAHIDGTDIVQANYNDIGIAVSSPRGLVVPVIRNAETRSFADIEQTIRGFGERAKQGTLAMEELTGGTFTITNGGIFGSLLSTPIINPPQSAILGMHKIQPRPVAESGEVVVRPMMYLALSYDHRIVDGREAVQFLVTIKEAIEDPARLLLDI